MSHEVGVKYCPVDRIVEDHTDNPYISTLEFSNFKLAVID